MENQSKGGYQLLKLVSVFTVVIFSDIIISRFRRNEVKGCIQFPVNDERAVEIKDAFVLCMPGRKVYILFCAEIFSTARNTLGRQCEFAGRRYRLREKILSCGLFFCAIRLSSGRPKGQACLYRRPDI